MDREEEQALRAQLETLRCENADLRQRVNHARQVEEAHAASEAEMRALFSGMSDVIMVFDKEGRYLRIAPTGLDLLYRPLEELVGQRLHDVFPPEQADFFLRQILHTLELGHKTVFEYCIPINNREMWFSAVASPMLTDQVLVVARDVTEQRHDREALANSEHRYRLIFDSNPLPMWVYDLDTLHFQAVNDAAVSHYGYSRDEFQAMTIPDIHPDEDTPSVLERIRETGPVIRKSGVWTHRKKDGTYIEVEITTHDMELDGRRARLVLAEDVTERNRLQNQLFQALKMESVGRLAGGVAHDFNNLLTAILGYAELAEEVEPLDETVRSYLGNIIQAAERAAGLTQQLLAFARRQIIEPKILNLNDLVLDTHRILRRLIGEDIELVMLCAPVLGKVKADMGQIEQVLVNLAVNARDAMPEGGRILIETSNVSLGPGYITNHPQVAPGEYVMLAVSDTGPGIPPEVQQHLFEPFFTTKAKGKGTGLGLATCYGIIKQSGGYIWAYSEPGRGSTFKVYLPRVEETGTPVPVPEEPAALPAGSETILLVEDEPLVRGIAAHTLRAQGYNVIEAGNGSEALRLAAEHSGQIDLLVTDVVMPQMGGRELSARLLKERPGLRVLYTSGYTDSAIVHQGVLDPGISFLQKPFAPAAIAHKVREVLDDRHD